MQKVEILVMTFAGDTYITKLENDLYGAFRVLKVGVNLGFISETECYLILITNFIDDRKPTLNDTRILQPLYQKRFHYNNEPCIAYYSGIIDPELFEYLGSIPLSEKEKALIEELESKSGFGFSYQGALREETGWQVFMEWRWTHEKHLMQKEENKNLRHAKEKLTKIDVVIESALMEDNFWKIFLLFDWSQKTDNEIIEPAVRYLSSLSVYDLRQFAEILYAKLYMLDTRTHAENRGNSSYSDSKRFFSADDFLGARCLVVAKGKIIFEELLTDPTKMPQKTEFIALLSLIPQAYYRKTGREFDYQPQVSYETFSNIEGWQ